PLPSQPWRRVQALTHLATLGTLSRSAGEGLQGLLSIAILLLLHLPPLVGDARELVLQILLGVAAEFAVDAEMRCLVERRAAQAAIAEMEEVGARETHEQRRMCGDY